MDYEAGVARSQAYYKMMRVSEILEVVEKTDGDFNRAADVLNWDADPYDDFLIFRPQEIVRIVEFASRNPISTETPINR